MEQNTESGVDQRAGVPTYVIDAVVACIMLALGLIVMFGSRKIGIGWETDGPGAGYFPFYIGLIIVISSVGILVQALRGKTRNTEIFVDGEQIRRVMSVLIPAVIYVLAVQYLGLYIASAVYIALFMAILGKYSWFKSIATGLAVNVALFLMFEVWFKVPLFKGKFDLLSFLGY